ncbi:MAG: hypothetical protein ACFCVK_20505 [Acidimicrobiales bacterium]
MPGYETVEQLQSAKAALIAEMPGWTPPAAYALGVSANGAEIAWRATNHRGIHGFPAVALSKVLGYRAGSATYQLDLDLFDAAIGILEPAGACKAYEHPNLWAWQALRAEISGDQLPDELRIFAVFIGDETDPVVDEPNRQLRRQLGIQELRDQAAR